MEEQQNRECSVMVSMNLPNKARETTLLPSNEQFGGGIGGVGDTGGGSGGDEQAGIINAYLFIYIITCYYLLYRCCGYLVLVLVLYLMHYVTMLCYVVVLFVPLLLLHLTCIAAAACRFLL